MPFERIVYRILPDGTTKKVYPFHVSLEGVENRVLCRDDEDYGLMVKYIFLCARRKNVLPVIYVAMSNHAHAAVLSTGLQDAKAFGIELKRCYAQYFSEKYGERKVLRKTSTDVQYLDSDWYVRNTLAYIPRNALDAGSRIEDYKWSGYRAMFRSSPMPPVPGMTGAPPSSRPSWAASPRSMQPVSGLTKRERIALFRTHDSLRDVPWLLDADGDIDPVSACDASYLESAFNHDQAFFLKTIGSVNMAEMEYKLLDAPRRRSPDADFFRMADDLAHTWFHTALTHLPTEKKYRLLPYVYHTHRTSIAQLARCFSLSKEQVAKALERGMERQRNAFRESAPAGQV